MKYSFDEFLHNHTSWEKDATTVTIRLNLDPSKSITCELDRSIVKEKLQPLYREWWFMKHGGPQ